MKTAAYVCDCCMLWLVNGDDSGCRDYYGHTHRRADLARLVEGHWYDVNTGDPEDDYRDSTDWEVWHQWTCDGCSELQYPGAHRWEVWTD